MRQDLATTVLVGAGLSLVRHAGLAPHRYLPLAVFGAATPGLLHTAILLLKDSITRCRSCF